MHVLIDGMGCDCVEGESLRRMREAGVEVEVYHLDLNLSNFNQRTHRKLLVIDGELGFTGGVGHRRPVDGKCRYAGSLAGHALPGGGAGRCPDCRPRSWTTG